jgi:hypothetical protein
VACTNGRDWRDEAVAPTWHRLDEAGIVCRIVQNLAQPADDRMEPVLEIDVRVARPDPAAKLLAGQQLARAFEQGDEDAQRLLMQSSDEATVTPQLARSGVELEQPDAIRMGRHVGALNRTSLGDRSHIGAAGT